MSELRKAQRLLFGLRFLESFGECEIAVNHDEFHAMVTKANRPMDEDTVSTIHREMELLGWHWSEDEETWSIFV